MSFQRWSQTICLVLFVGLLILSSRDLIVSFRESFFIQLDPSVAWLTLLSGRQWLMTFLPVLVLVVLTLLFGRFFCGHICPMGTTLDLAESVSHQTNFKVKNEQTLRAIKYLLLIALTGGALLGVSFVFWASPLSLITRFFALVLFPLIEVILSKAHQFLLPVWEGLDANMLLFLQIKPHHYSSQFFVVVFFIGVFLLGRLVPRFWCRYVCPAGAVLALLARNPIVRRTVSDHCTVCGKCASTCPMGAIDEINPEKTVFAECTVCLTCEKVCQEGAIVFAHSSRQKGEADGRFLPDRRRFLFSGIAGAGTAIISLTGLTSPGMTTAEGQVLPDGLIRPPAALPERLFLSRCIRCGACMSACPTNTLQPIGFSMGVIGVFSPAMILRKGFCHPDCHRCAEVCPTSAITRLPDSERQWAKTGTAVLHRRKCLAWEHERKCMVCDEVCPFDAIHFSVEKELSVTVPKVSEEKCTGCGYCEYHCPVQNSSAIVVSPMDAFRLEEGSFREHGMKAGFRFSRTERSPAMSTPSQPGPSGFLEEGHPPAPGFDLGD